MIKLVIADDEPLACSFIKRVVQDHFPQIGLVSDVGNGKAAVEKAAEIRADMAIMDIEMPIMDGIEASRRIKKENPDCIIIFLTAFAEFQYARQAVSLGAAEFVLKPIEEEELIRVIQETMDRCMGRHAAEQAVSAPEVIKYERPGEEVQTAGGDRISKIVQEAKAYIDTHYMDNISVEEIAAKYQLSTNYFNKVFRQYFDTACKEYIIGIRVEAAKQYLTSPILTVREVGCMVGYQDSNYFTKVFRKKMGITPTEYRNQAFFMPED